MTKTRILKATLGALALTWVALPVLAGSWPNIPASKSAAKAPMAQAAPASNDGFEYIGGEGGWSLEQYKYFRTEEGRGEAVMPRREFTRSAPAREPLANAKVASGFEYVGGDIGWQLSQHKYVRTNGRFAHSDECDHAIRVVKGPTPAEVEATQRLSPG